MPHLRIEILLESNPLRSRILVWRLAVRCVHETVASSFFSGVRGPWFFLRAIIIVININIPIVVVVVVVVLLLLNKET